MFREAVSVSNLLYYLFNLKIRELNKVKELSSSDVILTNLRKYIIYVK